MRVRLSVRIAPGCIVLVGVWIGFWAVADSAIYKASLTELCISRIRTTLLGLNPPWAIP